MSTRAMGEHLASADFLSARTAADRPGRAPLRAAWNIASCGSPALDFDAPFLAGSQAKMYTAACVLLLARSGALSLEDPVTRYVPECPPGITVRSLLSHRSGLGDHVLALLSGMFPATGTSPADLIALAVVHANSFQKGPVFYTNTGYFLLATLVERIADSSLAAFGAENFFRPLRMRRTNFVDSSSPGVAPLLAQVDEIISRDGLPAPAAKTLLDLGKGGGNLLTTLKDSLAFGHALMAEDSRFTLRHSDFQEESPGDDDLSRRSRYALGMEGVPMGDRRIWGHRGHFLSASSATFIDPPSRAVVAYVLQRRCRRELKPTREFLSTCDRLAEFALLGDAVA